ncbi:MAG: ABC transporter ATP-binding protein, partial [Chloroflexi bacterium]|nr:ABC transporter ATP-binding protein [Chloroflexota bacterium]
MTDSLRESADEVISVESLSKKFGDLVAVDDISFSVRRGEVFGILGPNGAGKTTTLECIEGLQKPSSGKISVLGTEVARDPNTVKERIGVQLQASAYFDYLTLTEILELFGRFYSRSVPAAELLSTVGLEDKASATVGKLSGGQQQRFTIAATLVNDPEIVFLDEPTAGLDPQARRNLWDFVQSISSQGRTIVLTTHYMEEAEFLCDRVAIMDQGRIVTLDTPTNLVRSLPVPYEVKASTLDRFSISGLADL